MSKRLRWDAIAIAGGAAVAVAAIGGTLTDLGPWYQSLAKPAWKPPDAAFGLIWTVIFSLVTISAVLAWRGAPTQARRHTTIGLFAFNGFLNVLWSLVFFHLKRPEFALIEVAVLWASILLLMIYTWPHSRPASLLLTPYLIWVSAASALNFEIVRLNGPFG